MPAACREDDGGAEKRRNQCRYYKGIDAELRLHRVLRLEILYQQLRHRGVSAIYNHARMSQREGMTHRKARNCADGHKNGWTENCEAGVDIAVAHPMSRRYEMVFTVKQYYSDKRQYNPGQRVAKLSVGNFRYHRGEP